MRPVPAPRSSSRGRVASTAPRIAERIASGTPSGKARWRSKPGAVTSNADACTIPAPATPRQPARCGGRGGEATLLMRVWRRERHHLHHGHHSAVLVHQNVAMHDILAGVV